MNKARIAFLGAGNMTRSLIAGLVKDNYPAKQLWIVDRNPDKCDLLARLYDVHIAKSLEEAVKYADVVILAVKPQQIQSVADEVGKQIAEQKPLVISIAAGVNLSALENCFGQHTTIVRAMPNTPALIQCGATGLYASEKATTAQKNLAEHIMRAVGVVVWAKNETQIDVITALSGSGPAYVFLIMEIMEKIASEMGLNEQAAHLLTIQTVYGAAKMALESPEQLSKLRAQVTSKGGTTEAALNTFAKFNLPQIFAEAMLAAKNHSIEISKIFVNPKQLNDHRGQ